jgi:hypothetical protein
MYVCIHVCTLFEILSDIIIMIVYLGDKMASLRAIPFKGVGFGEVSRPEFDRCKENFRR